MRIKLTKEEFIRRSMNGEVFEFNYSEYFYDATKTNPFRLDNVEINKNWSKFNGINEFTVVEPKPKTKKAKEWLSFGALGQWYVASRIMTDKEAKEYFGDKAYLPTGREFEVPE